MKKTYMQPTANVVEIKTEGLMQIVSNGDNTLNGGGSQGNLDNEHDEVLSREDGFFGF